MVKADTKSTIILVNVIENGKRGCPAGGHSTLPDCAKIKALIKPPKNIISTIITMIIPNTLPGTGGFSV